MRTTVRRAYRGSARMRGRRRALMMSCASLAIAAAAMAPREARAQAFNGTMTPTTGVTQTFGTGTETITVSNATTTLDWTADDGTTSGNINFLPSANSATFTSTTGITDYTVLNRVVPTDATRAIELNGTVVATLQGSTTTGGNVWFYSPGGIVVGSTAVFDVGGLLLSTIDVSGLSNSSSGFSASFAKSQATAGAIQILSGAQINALQQNSYVALVGPRVEQGGNVRVDGSAAFVAAEQLTMTMNQGLFDIAVDVDGGTADTNGIVHSGSTTGPANATAYHKIYMAAVPKNQAMTMLLSGTVGYDATTAFVDGGQIILSAGHTPYDYGGGISFGSPVGVSEGAIDISGGDFRSYVQALANTGISASGQLSFAGDVWLNSRGPVVVSAFEGESITIGGNAYLWSTAGADGAVTLAASGGGSVDVGGDAVLVAQGQFDGTATRAGSIAVTADGGSVNVAGSLQGSAVAWDSGTDANGNDSFGGSVNLYAANGGSITANILYANVYAIGGTNAGGGDQTAGNGTGGSILVDSALGGSITINSVADANAYGEGGSIDGAGALAGTGTGGSILFRAEGGSVGIGSIYANAQGTGGSVYNAVGTTATGGTGDGGAAGIETVGSDSSFSVDSISLNANAYGGSGHSGGSALAGVTWVESFGGTITVDSGFSLFAQAHGGDAILGFGGTGGFAQGGVTAIEAHFVNGPTSSIVGLGSVYLDTGAWGGDGGAGDGISIAAGAGGDAQGGLYTGTRGSGGAFILADSAGGSVQVGSVTMYADAFGGIGGLGGAGQAGGAGGNAFGGTVQSGTFNPSQGTAALGTAVFGNVYMNASGYAGDGGLGDGGNGGAAAGDGGNATAGDAYIGAVGTVSMSGATLQSHAYGGDGSTGGDAVGGVAQAVGWTGASTTLDIYGSLYLDSNAYGGNGTVGGTGTGGYVAIGALDGASVDVANLYLGASGQGVQAAAAWSKSSPTAEP